MTEPTIGILYPGEMGSSFGKLLAESGFPVVTTTQGRSARTQSLCHEAGMTVLASIPEVLHRSAIVISLVTPAAALEVARQVSAQVPSSSRRLIYVDANSISPSTALQIAGVLGSGPVDFVDASILGLASLLRQRGRLYLSGSRASEVSNVFSRFMRVKITGEAPGQASAFKMIIAGIPKGLVGLFVETMLFARDMGLLREALEACNELYCGVMEVAQRMLPTYPQHAARRSEELREIEATMLLNGSTPRILRAVLEVTADLAKVDWVKGREPAQGTVAEILEEIHRSRTRASSAESATRL
ncbi:MAG: DUF1932 domain-containing protein [Acidobacteriia bacterium]|nr:DUF1932 domain-containing protein [Terriglobia bacterium]